MLNYCRFIARGIGNQLLLWRTKVVVVEVPKSYVLKIILNFCSVSLQQYKIFNTELNNYIKVEMSGSLFFVLKYF